MSDKVLKIKCNENASKWCLTVLFLLGNFIFLGLLDRNLDNTERLIIIIIPIISNLLAIALFVIFSIFPRIYYCIDSDGVSVEDRKGELIGYIPWSMVNKIECCYACGIQNGYLFVFCLLIREAVSRLRLEGAQQRVELFVFDQKAVVTERRVDLSVTASGDPALQAPHGPL